MRSSSVLVLVGATIAMASPVNHQAMHKKAYVTDIITDIVYVTVTAGNLPTTTPSDTTVVVKHTVYAAHKPTTPPAAPKPVATTPPPPPPPAPTTFVEAPKPVTPTPAPTPEAPAPAPVVQEAPAVKQVEAPAAAKPTDYKSTCLYNHDAHRDNHTAPHLAWDDTLADNAKASANKCVFAHDMTQGGGGYGQNLAAYGTTADMSSIDLASVVADAITNQWYYGEAANMPYGQDNPAIKDVPEYLHFSQVLWKSTTKVGCFTAQCGAGTIFPYHSLYTVCNYASTGNVLGSFSSEVGKPIGLPGITAHIG